MKSQYEEVLAYQTKLEWLLRKLDKIIEEQQAFEPSVQLLIEKTKVRADKGRQKLEDNRQSLEKKLADIEIKTTEGDIFVEGTNEYIRYYKLTGIPFSFS
ncbi:Hypothetical predicted protein [Paramuricea clavata]|uniref:Uncharacterized protein n=1 Tax=Paramuricea clavata TaxID=317549 RepID=A0A7D9J339_PARCT|nr:Hypothetical predicted protein [Paramuricea clavata]